MRQTSRRLEEELRLKRNERGLGKIRIKIDQTKLGKETKQAEEL